jgi:hypothetical protein
MTPQISGKFQGDFRERFPKEACSFRENIREKSGRKQGISGQEQGKKKGNVTQVLGNGFRENLGKFSSQISAQISLKYSLKNIGRF